MTRLPLHDHLPVFLPNRVWRTYQGGRILDQLAQRPHPADTHYPEDWIGSVVQAVNPGEHPPQEGLSHVRVGSKEMLFADLLATDPAYYLGANHIARWGTHPGLLVKFLDSAIRLHLQVHPTAQFAQQFLQSPSGKAEAYYVLEVRPDTTDPCIYLGFQRPPERSELRRMILEQDIDGLKQCFDRIPVKPGDVIFIPGGHPHAIGKGIFMVEILEPSDLAVRFEFERGGYPIPESARFMNKSLDFCLDIFNCEPLPVDVVKSRYMPAPRTIRTWGMEAVHEELIGTATTPCFRVHRSRINGSFERSETEFFFAIVTRGHLTITTPAGKHQLKQYDRFMIPAGMAPQLWQGHDTEILECFPPPGVA